MYTPDGSKGFVTSAPRRASMSRSGGCRWANPGDVRPVGEGVSELRIDHEPGYRVYFVRREPALAVLLAGGDKRTQLRDIAKAREPARGL